MKLYIKQMQQTIGKFVWWNMLDGNMQKSKTALSFITLPVKTAVKNKLVIFECQKKGRKHISNRKLKTGLKQQAFRIK